MLFIFPAIWGCTEIVYEFLEATKVSISATDMTPLFCYIFFTLYYFSHAMVVSRIKGRNPVKSCFIYGLPAVALALSYSVYRLFSGLQEGGGYVSVLNACMFFVLALYAVSFIAEMGFNSVTKDEIEVIDGLPKPAEIEEEENAYINTEDYKDLVFSDDSDQIDTDENPEAGTEAEEKSEKPSVVRPSEYYQNAQGIDDFIIGYEAPEDDEPVPYLTRNEINRSKDSDFVVGVNTIEDVKDAEENTEPAEEAKAEPAAEEKAEPVAEAKTDAKDETHSAVEDLLKELDSKV